MNTAADNRTIKEYISVLSVISAIAVVYLHANGCFWSFSTEPYWISANIIESLLYFGVPVFFMIPGATLLNFYERYGLKTFFVNRIKKTLIPYIAWSIIGFILFIIFVDKGSFSDITLSYFMKALIGGQLVQTYWFFPVLFCVYLCLPLFAAVSEDKRKSVFSYLAIISLLLNIVIPFVLRILGSTYSLPYSVSVGSGYLLYVLLGYLLDKYELRLSGRIIIYILSVAGLLTHLIGTYVLSVNANEIVKLFKEYNNLPCVCYSVGVFVFVKACVDRFTRAGQKNAFFKSIDFLKQYTLEIYLLHWFVLKLIIKVFSVNTTALTYRLLAPLPVIVISIAVTYLLRKIPGIRMIVPS